MTVKEFRPEGVAAELEATRKNPLRCMFFRSHLTGPSGAHFELLKEKHHSPVDVVLAKRYIRHNRDAVSISVILSTEKTKEPIKIKFQEWDCTLEFAKYANGRHALVLVEEIEPYEQVATATINLPNESIEEDEIFIKDYSENSGMVKALMNANIIGESVRNIQLQFVTVPVHKLLVKPS